MTTTAKKPRPPTKSQAFEDLMDAMKGDKPVSVQSAALNAYRRAPRGSFDIDKVMETPLGPITARQYLEWIATSSDFPQLSRWFHRVPKKRNLRRRTGPVPQWSTEVYRHIQQVRRTPNSVPSTTNYINARRNNIPSMDNLAKARRNSAWLGRYMTHHALRAPALPLRAPRTRLYRGMTLTPAQLEQLKQTREWSDKGFMAFSRKLFHACTFGSRPGRASHFVLFRLRQEDVARGTPWIWYTGMNWNLRDDEDTLPSKPGGGWDLHLNPLEQEVLLPPGTLRVNSLHVRTHRWIGNCKLDNDYKGSVWFDVDASYVPDPEFAPKPRRKGTRESGNNIPWDIFANDTAAATRKRGRGEPAANNSRPQKRWVPWLVSWWKGSASRQKM